MATTHHLKVIRPYSEKCAVALPVRKPNAAYRSREHLTEREVERLVEAAKDNSWGHRDATMVPAGSVRRRKAAKHRSVRGLSPQC